MTVEEASGERSSEMNYNDDKTTTFDLTFFFSNFFEFLFLLNFSKNEGEFCSLLLTFPDRVTWVLCGERSANVLELIRNSTEIRLFIQFVLCLPFDSRLFR